MPRLEDDADDDYTSTAQFLNHETGRISSRSPDFHRARASSGGAPMYSRRGTSQRSSGGRRVAALAAVRRRLPSAVHGLFDRGEELVMRFSPLQQALLGVAGFVLFILGILFLVFHKKLLAKLVPFVEAWRNSKVGWLVLWLMVIAVSFPPMIGYSTCFTLAGFVFGVWRGYLIITTATIVGSTLSFLVCRHFLRDYVQRMTAKDKRFEALALTLKHDGLKLLIMIRLCPLPYSLSNGAISAIPTVTPAQFAIANLIASPKLLVGIFIGSRLGGLAEGNDLDFRTKVLSWISILIGVCVAVGTGWFMYVQTQKRARELEALEQQQGNTGGARRSSQDDFEYSDDPADRAAVANFARAGDGISLHSAAADNYADDDEGGDHPAEYRDEWADDGDIGADASSLDAVFQAGDGEDESEPTSPVGYRDEDTRKDRR
ncbi:hypothetical protein ANO11243_045050 [Dothideomycetidae sp. 11243]|nr:hypothetical protein ANO11243_045050 [fungal sp. No.11243]